MATEKEEFKFPDEVEEKEQKLDIEIEGEGEEEIKVEVVDDTPPEDRDVEPLTKDVVDELEEEQINLLNVILMGIESYLPLDAIVAQLNSNPLKVKQETLFKEDEIKALVSQWRNQGISENFIQELLKTEIYKNKEGYFENAKH